ncbi:MAG TPA: hypothetical protein PKH02_09925 [Bacteroidales bacterium]|nr:hypothetical protein [Bacteroidales bacterium]HPT22283.1 hypothetical protein [Bacteroidales bacterium]
MFKIALIFLIITLIISLVSVSIRAKGYSRNQEKKNDKSRDARHVSKATGEYVDFEDLGEKDNQ